MKNICLSLFVIVFLGAVGKPDNTLKSVILPTIVYSWTDTLILTIEKPPIISPRVNVKLRRIPPHVDEFIREFYPLACHIEQKYGIPKVMTLGIAALESGWGRSYAAKERFNFFGLYGGKKYYKNKLDGFEGLGKFLKFKRYKPLIGVTDYKEYCKLLHTTGYNPYPHYPAKLQRLIELFGLQDI